MLFFFGSFLMSLLPPEFPPDFFFAGADEGFFSAVATGAAVITGAFAVAVVFVPLTVPHTVHLY